MDTVLGWRTSQWRPTDWAAAAVAGLAAGAMLMVLDMVWSSIFDPAGPWRISHMIAPIFTGAHPAATTGYVFSVGIVSISLAAHYVLGIIFGLVLAPVMAQLELDTPARALPTGAIVGLLLYLLNFHVWSIFFPWLADLRGGDTLAAHVVFGVVAALLYCRLKRTAAER